MKRATYNYGALRDGASALIQSKGRLDNKLTEMKNMIANMVSGDFKTTSASGKLNEVYGKFTTDAGKCLSTMQRTSEFLRGVIEKQQQVEGDTTNVFQGLGGG